MKYKRKIDKRAYAVIACLLVALGFLFYDAFLDCLYDPYPSDYKPYDKIYVINLDRSVERWEKIKSQLDRYGLEYERFSAVDGYKVRLTDQESGEVITGQDIKDKTKKLIKGHKYNVHCPATTFPGEYVYEFNLPPLSAGELGLECVYRELEYKIANGPYDKTILLEDDAVLSLNFRSKLFKALDNMPKDYGIAYFYSKGCDQKFTKFENEVFFEFKPALSGTDVWGTVAFIISKKGAKKLFNAGHKFDNVVDRNIASLLDHGELKTYRLKKNIVSHADREVSDLDIMGERWDAEPYEGFMAP